MENLGIFNTDPRVKKKLCTLNITFQELKSKTLSLEKIKDDPSPSRLTKTIYPFIFL